jgi:Tfp pilus assembly protein PilN
MRMIASLRLRAGIQIGQRHIKLVVIQKKGKQWDVILQETETAPEEIVKDGKVLRPELIGLQIRKMWMKHRIKVRQVSVFVEEMPFFVRRLRLPKMPKKEVPQAIAYKASLELPVDIRDLVIRYYPLRRQASEDQGNLDDYILIAAYRPDIDQLVRAVQAAGLSVRAIGFEPEAIFSGLVYAYPDKNFQQTRLLVQMGTSRMMMAVLNDGQLNYARYIPIRSNEPDGMREIAREIERTVMGWESSGGGETIRSIILLGEKEECQKIREHLESHFSGETVILSAPFAACVGAVLPAGGKINFYADSTQIYRLIHSPVYFKAALLALLVMLAAGMFEYGSVFKLRKDIRHLEELLDQNREVVTMAGEKLALLQLEQRLKSTEDDFARQHVRPVFLYELVMDHLPPGIAVRQIYFSQRELMVSGYSPGQGEVTQLLASFQEDERFAHVSLVHSGESGDRYSFTMKMERSGDTQGGAGRAQAD